MELILKIAWRNILRHKGKSIIIGIIIFLGSLIMTLGNGVIAGMEHGLQKNIVAGFTGDIVIISEKQETDNVLFTVMGKAIEPIYNFLDIKKMLAQKEYIEKFLPAGRDMAMILNEEGGAPGFAFLLGVDFGKYEEMFPHSMKPIEGKLPKDNERGAIIPTNRRKEFYDFMGLWYLPSKEKFNVKNFKEAVKEEPDMGNIKLKDSIIFLGYSDKNTTQDIRLDVKGIVKFNALNTIFGHYNLVDIESFRECLGFFSGVSRQVNLSEEKKKILEMENENLDELFSEGVFADLPSNAFIGGKNKKTAAPIQTDLKLTPVPAALPGSDIDKEAGAYNVIFVKLKKGISLEDGLKKINRDLKENNLKSRAVSWKKAFGFLGSMAIVIKGALVGFVMLIFFVAVIIIVNTLTMAAIERTTEIGMMRAIGARKSFIGTMFLGETGILTVIFGGAGIIAGVIVVKIIPLFNITSDNDMVQLLFGGDSLFPVLSLSDIFITTVQLLFVTTIAVIYPIKIAKGITPLEAIARD
ncbi:MAG: FtsX-like permease family protein [Nitrospinae bacterium]|nr:FtsX-like permease family protein [Nitrospinota bacterium]